MDLQGKVAWITGGGAGIGRATALRFAQAGARVAVLATSEGELRAVAAEVRKLGADVLTQVADVREARAMQDAAGKIRESWDRLDVVIANAGINGVWAPIEELTPGEWDETFDVNLRGTFLTLKHAIPHMKARGGSIVVTSSVNGTRIFSDGGESLLQG
jgi:NAD(P)-dependent dehydrogenase (short-subunit alcohol dehydrogenase family)